MTLREATWWDAWRIWRWRNDPSGRAMMRNTGRVGPIEHILWFREMLSNDDRVQYVALYAGRAVGTGRLDRYYDVSPGVEIDIVIAPTSRGRGHGGRLIRELTRRAFDLPCVRYVVAVIRKDNAASICAFTSAGFQHHDEMNRFSVRYVQMRYTP